MKIVIHLGVHKTASTLLQHNLSTNIDHVRAQNVFYANEETPRLVKRQSRILRRFCNGEDVEITYQELAKTNTAIMDAAKTARAHTVILSDENRLGEPMHEALANGTSNPCFYPMAEACLSASLRALPPKDVRLLLYTRNPESYLLSLYSDAIRDAKTNLDLESFCRAVNFNSIDFEGLQKRLQSANPAMDIQTRQYERVKLGPDTYLRTFLRDIGLDPKPFKLQKSTLRPQLDRTQVEALLHIMAGGHSKRWRLVKRLRDQVLAGAPNPLVQLTLPDWVTDSMRVTADGRASDAA